MAHTKEPWAINGKTAAGYRIDSINPQGRSGLDHIMNPVAIVPRKGDAELIILAPELLKQRDDALKVLNNIKRFLEHGPEFPYHLLADTEELQEEVEKSINRIKGNQ